MDQKNLDIYGDPPIPWSRAQELLEEDSSPHDDGRPPKAYWLSTVRPDGRPHVAAVGAVWVDDRFYFTSGPGTRKSRDIAGNPNCVISVSLSGLDLVVEGSAIKVRDEPTLQRVAKVYAAGGWPARVENGAFTYDYSAPSAGPPPWDVYEFTPTTAFGVATAEPNGATRWRFKEAGAAANA
jgi:hypothetical protein